MRAYLVLIALAALLAAPAFAAATAQSSVAAHTSKYGNVLFDGRGFVVYAFTHDPRDKSTCAGTCAQKWPPYIVSARPSAGAGAKDSLIGTTTRSDGKLQATYAGRPLYYFVGDKKPGDIRCQNVTAFGGVWLVVAPNGQTVTASNPK